MPDKPLTPDEKLQQEFNQWASAGEGEKMERHHLDITEKTIRLSLARAAMQAARRATELIGQGKPESHPEVVAQQAVANAFLTAAASIGEAFETGVLPSSYPEVK